MGQKSPWWPVYIIYSLLFFVIGIGIFGFRMTSVLTIVCVLVLFFLPKPFITLFLSSLRKIHAVRQGDNRTEFFAVMFVLFAQHIVFLHVVAVRHLTRLFPFSLFHSGMIQHAGHTYTRAFVRDLEAYAAGHGMPITIKSVMLGEPFVCFPAVPNGTYRKDKSGYMRNLERLLQEKYGTIYVREEKSGFRIMVLA